MQKNKKNGSGTLKTSESIKKNTRQGSNYWGHGSTTQLQAHHLIRKLLIDRDYDYTQQQLADIFRVSISTISRIATYRV